MKKKTLLLLLFSVTLFSQKRNVSVRSSFVTISGTILEATQKIPLEYATVLLEDINKKTISGGVTNSEGKFTIQIPKGSYKISIEYIGFKIKKFPTLTYTEDYNLGTIFLHEDTEQLDEVEIIAEKSTVEIRLDKKIYNVGKDMTLKGGNASDVLDNVPSVTVDAEGSISLRGNENVRILIDGKPSSLVGLNGADALRNLPADAIEKVEVITSPSARYDAEGTAGILNIILRKGKVLGVNGAINITTGYPSLLQITPNINYRTKKINLFSTMGYSYRKGPGNSFSEFLFYNKDALLDSIQIEDRLFDRKSNNLNGTLGLDYYLSKHSTVTGSFFYRKSRGNDTATNITEQLTPEQLLKNRIKRIENENENKTDKQFSLNYTENFDKNGKKLVVDLQYSNSNEIELAPITENGVLIEQNSQTTQSTDQLVQVDYIHPIKENSQFETGYKSTFQDLHSNFRVGNVNNLPFNYDPSNAINFKQNIHALYAQFGSKIHSFSYLLGLRTEITDIDLRVLTTNQFSDKNYTEWFPTINLGYELNDTNNLTIGYNRRIRRPRFWFLNPFESRSSATNIFKGNPAIDPMFTNSLDIGFTTKIKKLSIGASIYYQHSTDIIQMVSIIENRNNTKVFIRQPTNLNSEKRHGFEITSNYTAAKWAKLSTSFNYFKFKRAAFDHVFTGSNGNEIVTPLPGVASDSWLMRINSRITLPTNVQWQTKMMYRGAQEEAQSNRKGMFSADMSFSKDLFKEKATLVLNVRDLLNSRRRENITYNGDRMNPSSIVNGDFQWRERQISLSLTYRFNQKKKRERPSRRYQEDRESYGG